MDEKWAVRLIFAGIWVFACGMAMFMFGVMAHVLGGG